MKLKALLWNDFIDDPSMEPDADYAPVKLSLLNYVQYTFSTVFTCMGEETLFYQSHTRQHT